MRKSTVLIAGFAALAVVAGIFASSPAGGGIHQVLESDGRVQTDYRILGLVPYTVVRKAPEVRATKESERKLKEAGVFTPALAKMSVVNGTISRQKAHTHYFLRVNAKLDPAALMSHYAKLMKVTPLKSFGGDDIWAEGKIGSKFVYIAVTPTPGTAKVRDTEIVFRMSDYRKTGGVVTTRR